MSGVEISSAENAYLATMRGLDGFVRELTDGDRYPMQIVDLDVAPQHIPLPAPPPMGLCDFQAEIEKVQSEIGNDEREAGLMHRSLASARVVLGVLAGGNDPDYRDLVEASMGVRPERIPERDLRRRKEELDEIVSRLGYRYEEEDREAFAAEYSLPPGLLEDSFEDIYGLALQDLATVAGDEAMEGLKRPRLEVSHHQDLWQGYFGVDEDKGYFIKGNSNPLIKLTRFGIRAILDHEDGHWLSIATKAEAIKAGELSPVAGLLTVPSPMYLQEEIIARTVEEYILAEQSGNGDLAKYIYKSMKYAIDVGINMMIMVNEGYSREEIVNYGRGYLPFEKPEKIKDEVDMYAESLLYKTVFAVDGHSLRRGREIASRTDRERRAILSRLCIESLPPDELLKI